MRNQPDRFSVDDRHRVSGVNRVVIGTVGVLVLLLVVAVVVTHLRPSPGDPSARSPASTGAGGTATVSSPPSTVAASPAPSTTPAATVAPVSGDATGTPAAGALTATGTFVDAWLSRGTPAQRQKLLSPVTAPALLTGLVQTDPTVLPRARRDGLAQLQSGTPVAAIYRVALTDGNAVLVDIVLDGDGSWKATAVQPAPAG
jgi:hypothetical protein